MGGGARTVAEHERNVLSNMEENASERKNKKGQLQRPGPER
jgi:hypothetical protein